MPEVSPAVFAVFIPATPVGTPLTPARMPVSPETSFLRLETAVIMGLKPDATLTVILDVAISTGRNPDATLFVMLETATNILSLPLAISERVEVLARRLDVLPYMDEHCAIRFDVLRLLTAVSIGKKPDAALLVMAETATSILSLPLAIKESAEVFARRFDVLP